MITVTIWRSALKKAGACSNGIALFDAVAAMQDESDPKRLRRIKVRWTRLHQVWFMAAHGSYYRWLVDNGLAPEIGLYGANLDGANLDGANLSRANLYGANLDGANLDGANLYGAYRPYSPPDGWEPSESGHLRRKVAR